MGIRINVPDDVIAIINRLDMSGYEAYAVGGCVRDSIMLREPKDWDITTRALPYQVEELFPNVIETGVKHGTVTVILGGKSYEVTTFRMDGEYTDGRHPSSVTFTANLEQDLMRRDFTVNAMAYNPAIGLIDPWGGMEDIKAKKLRTVGNPDERFGEDALRMLRAIRLSAELKFYPEAEVLLSIKRCRHLINKISPERIRQELSRILVSDAPGNLALLYDTGLMDEIIPELSACFRTEQHHPFHIYNVGEHSLKAVENIEQNTLLRWVMLLHDTGKPICRSTDSKGIDHFYGHPLKSAEIAKKIMDHLRFEKNFIEKAVRLVKYHDLEVMPDRLSVKKALLKIGDDLFPSLLKVAEADKRAQNPEKLGKRLDIINKVKEEYEKIKSDGDCISLKMLAVNGHDLMQLGFCQGKELGGLMERLFWHVIRNPGDNRREKLLELAVKLH